MRKKQINTQISDSTRAVLSEILANVRRLHGEWVGMREVLETAIIELAKKDPKRIKIVQIERGKRGRPPKMTL